MTKADRERKLGLLIDRLQTQALKHLAGSPKQKKIIDQYQKIRAVLAKYNPNYITPVQELLLQKIALENSRQAKKHIQR